MNTLYLLIFLGALALVACTTQVSTEQTEEVFEQEQVAPVNYFETGQNIVRTAFEALSSQLVRAIEEEGHPGAVAFCQVAAPEILASVALPENVNASSVTIARTSMRWRSSANRPDKHDLILLDEMQVSRLKGEEPLAVLEADESRVYYYHPILVQPLCMNCHGMPLQHISEETLATIDVLYPDDRARGYKTGDLRGMWKVSWEAVMQ